MQEVTHRPGLMGSSPTYYTPASDRERAIGRLQEIAGDPSIPAVYQEQSDARAYLKQIIRDDPELRQRLRYYKQFVDAPNGKERLYKEIVLPKMFEQIRFPRHASSDYDYSQNSPIDQWTKKGVITFDYSMSPWFRGYYYQYSDFQQFWNYLKDKYVPELFALSVLGFWTRGYYLNYFGDKRTGQMIRNAKLSRRYYGRHIPRIPAPAHSVRNKMVLQAITRKMLREGRAHNIHLQQALNSLPK